VVHGAAGWDEATPIGPFLAFDVAGIKIRQLEVDPEEFGIARCRSSELLGGDARTNFSAMLDVFAGRDRGPHRDALVLQCGIALNIAGRAQSIAAGIDAARESLDSGAALSWLKRLQDFAANRSGTQGRA
jgi:anthranilate phosphoribosyltransferase